MRTKNQVRKYLTNSLVNPPQEAENLMITTISVIKQCHYPIEHRLRQLPWHDRRKKWHTKKWKKQFLALVKVAIACIDANPKIQEYWNCP